MKLTGQIHIADTPEWERIMKMASTVLKAFNYQQKN